LMSEHFSPSPKPAPRVKKPRPPKVRKPMKRVNVERRAEEFERAYGGTSRVAFVKSLACVAGRVSLTMSCAGAIENAHIRTGGTGRKADAKLLIPLCTFHHRALHAHGPVAFERVYGLDLEAEAAATQSVWEAFVGGMEK
jgi:hypothetical protein